MKGVEIRAPADPMTIEIVASDKRTAQRIRALTREEAVVVQGERP
jgi:hypothetical protein